MALAALVLLADRPVATLTDALRPIASADPAWAAAALGFETASFAGYVALLWLVAGRAAPRFDLRTSYQVTLAGAAATRLLPTGGMGGAALALWTLGRAGRSGRDGVRTLLTFLVLLYAVFFAAIAVAGGAIVAGGGDGGTSLAALPAAGGATVIVVALWLGLRRRHPPIAAPSPTSRAARLRAHAGILGEAVAGALAFARRGDPRLAGAAVWWACDIAVLWAAFNAFGAPPPVAVLVLGYFVGQVANTIPLPGATSGGLVGALVALGAPLDVTLASVLAYRAVAVWTPVPAGALALAGLRRTTTRWAAEDRRSADGAAAQLQDAAGVGAGHEVRPGGDQLPARREEAVARALHEQDDRQEALEVGLLVDGERQPTVADGREDLGPEVERRHHRALRRRQRRQAVDGEQAARRVERPHGVDAALAHRGRDRGAGRRVLVVDADDPRATADLAHGALQAAAARVEPLVGDLEVDAQGGPRAGAGEAPTRMKPGPSLGLPHVGEHAEAAVAVCA